MGDRDIDGGSAASTDIDKREQPHPKRRKMMGETDDAGSKHEPDVHASPTSSATSGTRVLPGPVPVLSQARHAPVTTIKFVAWNIHPKAASRLLAALKSSVPIDPLYQHLRRVRRVRGGEKDSKSPKLQILLRPISPSTEDSPTSVSPCGSADDTEGAASRDACLFDRDFYASHVGAVEHFERDVIGTVEVEVAEAPPLTRRQFDVANMLWPVVFHENRVETLSVRGERFSATEVATFHQHMADAFIEANKVSDVRRRIGCVIVDPQSDSEVARGKDASDEHPLQHAVMQCVAEVAAKYDRALKNQETDGRVQRETEYLCTRYDLYVTREPCAMCAMALVHSRIRRVFYAHPNPGLGALGSVLRVHTLQGTNHHFEVFQLPTNAG